VSVLGLVFALFFLPQPSHADAACLDAAQVKSLQAAIDLPAIESNELCMPRANNYKLYQAMLFMKNFTFNASQVPAPFNQGILGGGFWDFFRGTVHKVQNESNPDACKGTLAFALINHAPGAVQDGIIHICPNYYGDSIGIPERVSIVLHETRHFQGFDHVKCESFSLLKGTVNCDNSITDKGAFAVTMESLADMIFAPSNLSATDIARAKHMILNNGVFVFNQPILPQGSLFGVYLQTEDGRGWVYDGTELKSVPVVADSHLISRLSVLEVFPNNKADTYTADLLSETPLKQDPVGNYGIQYNLFLDKDRVIPIDMIFEEEFQVLVREHDVNVAGYDPVTMTWTARVAFTARELGDSDPNAFYVVDTASQWHKFTWNQDDGVQITDVAARSQIWKAAAVINGVHLALTQAGEVMIDEKADGTSWTSFQPLAGQKYASMTRQFWWTSMLYTK